MVKKMNKYLYKVIDWIVRIVGNAGILIVTSMIFNDTLYVDSSYYGFWILIASLLIYLLNKTLKPFLVWLTIPITGLTLGLFYPFINLAILKIVSFIMQSHFNITGIWFALFACVLISVLNVLLDMIVLKKLEIKGEKK